MQGQPAQLGVVVSGVEYGQVISPRAENHFHIVKNQALESEWRHFIFWKIIPHHENTYVSD